MTIYETIFKRKSTRKYDMKALPESEITEIMSHVKNLKPLYEGIKVEYELTDNVKNIAPVKAPHYLIVSSETGQGYLENVGFMIQQLDLYLQSKGYGACWLGMAKPNDKIETALEFVIILAFGKAVDSPYRELGEFKRKAIKEISSGSDYRLECVRIAPSASNTQNWFFACTDGKIHCYQKNLNIMQSILYEKMNKIDMGIAICHLSVATENKGGEFTFTKEDVNELKGHKYIGTVN